MTEESLLARIDRVESHLAIQQLAARYALAVDSKDVDGVVSLFVEDVNAGGSWGTGREALTRFYGDALSHFYRSMHLIAGHVIAFDDGDHAHGVVHCRAEHEAGSQWGIMVMNYQGCLRATRGDLVFPTPTPSAPLHDGHPVTAERARFPSWLGRGRRAAGQKGRRSPSR